MISTKISELTARSVYLAWKSGKYSSKQLSEKYNISENSVSRIITLKLARRKVSAEIILEIN